VTIGGAALTLSGAAIVRSVLPEELFSQVWLVRNVTASTSTQLLDGDACGVTASGITLTLPTSPVAGDRVQIYQADNAVLSVIVDPFGEKINGVAGTMTIDVYDFSFDMIYISSAYGWKVLK
jgi:hypothetical protein